MEQHEKIAGYRTLTSAEIVLMNDIKAAERNILYLCDTIEEHLNFEAKVAPNKLEGDPYRWLAIARTEFEKSSMFLTRAVARPNNK